MLYSISDARQLIGSLIVQPSLILNDKYPLSREDFEPNRFHKIMYAIIDNLVHQGINKIDELTIGEYIQPYEVQREILEDNNYLDFIHTMKELAEPDNFEYYYYNVRKYSILRQYKEAGFDVTPICDETDLEEKQQENVNKFSLEEIVEYFESKQATIRRQFQMSNNIEEYVAGADFMETKEKFKTEPLVGASFQSKYLNAIYRGMYGMIIRGGKSGGGKTTMSIGDLCKVCCTHYWDADKQEYVENKSRVGAGLFINTEMELREQLDPTFIAWISNVPRHHIIDGKYDIGEEERVNKAAEILINSQIYVVDDPEFTTKSLVSTIRDYVLRYQIKNVCFDYIQNNGYVAKEISMETKVPQREDMVLLTLTDRLKQVQRLCGIGLITGVQLNGKEDETDIPLDNCLAGGKAQARKTDGAMVMMPPKKKELEQVEELIDKRGIGEHMRPNMVVHIIKGRNSRYPVHLKVFQYIDTGTARSYDLFCTDSNNKPIKVSKLNITAGEVEEDTNG